MAEAVKPVNGRRLGWSRRQRRPKAAPMTIRYDLTIIKDAAKREEARARLERDVAH